MYQLFALSTFPVGKDAGMVRNREGGKKAFLEKVVEGVLVCHGAVLPFE